LSDFIISFIQNIWILLNSISIYILIGIIIAGVFKLLFPDKLIQKHLGSNSFISNLKAAALGIPLPLCSCSVIPFIGSLKKSGASNSSILTFLISTPITGADSILATYGVFGWIFTIYRVISSLLISLLAGFLSLIFIKEEVKNKPKTVFSAKPQNKINTSYAVSVNSNNKKKTNILFEIYDYAFNNLLKDISKSLLMGILLGALIVSFIPENLSSYLQGNQWLNYILIVAISMPLYVCATASIPIAIALVTAGFSAGAGFIFLTAGPATNSVTMSVVFNNLGKKSLIIYMVSVMLGSILFGYIFDIYFASYLSIDDLFEFDVEKFGLIDQISSIVLLVLLLKYQFKK